MKRVKLTYKGKEIGIYDNKRDAQGVIIVRLNENPEISIFDFDVECVEFPVTIREAKDVLGTNEKACFLVSGDGGITLSRTKLQVLCNEADANNINALLAFNKLLTIARAWNKIDHFEPSYESEEDMFIPCFGRTEEGFKLTCVSQVVKSVLKYPAEMCFKTAERAAYFGELFAEEYKKILL